ncbi:hypothetical protein P8Q88_06395 [Qipengyuania sp. XHP0207]|uniref:hypothetical protein n=1 Tax=Qipengyuania sp. XHP0207 TaxID=3038078 RepID=UPI00241E15D9|nr:hypothetical protein [Qipengyuania sp. XHP0207]MDG5747804.1 hypothetical protein [Qipengyuania sp. XHP0207]
MRYGWLALPVVVGVGATLIAAQEKQPVAARSLVCVDPLPQGEAQRYFAQLSAALREKRDAAWFDRFAARRLGVVRKGVYTQHERTAGGAITPAQISITDWREIARRGVKALEPVGRKGCLMDNGKAWFAVEEDGTLRLITINHDMPWSPRSSEG